MLDHEVLIDTVCPHCGFKMDAATALEGKVVPKPGDLAVCAGCAKLCQYDDDLALKFVTESVWEQVPEDDKRKIIVCCRFLRQRIEQKNNSVDNSRTNN